MPQFNTYTMLTTEFVATGATSLPVAFQSQCYLPAGTQFLVGAVTVTVRVNSLLNEAPASIPVVALSAGIPVATSFTIQIDDNTRIRKHLQLPLNARTVVATQMDLVQAVTPGAVAPAQAALAELDALEAVLATFATDAGNTALIKAGPLEWNQGGKTAGVLQRQGQLITELANYLDLPVGGSSVGALYRS